MAHLDLHGSRILITGASSGIGAAMARAFAKRGGRLALAARRREALDQLADEIEHAGAVRPIVIPVDLSVRGEATALGTRAIELLGGVDVLVNNAGVGAGASQIAGGDGELVRQLFETNYWSPLALIQTIAPRMRDQGNGAIVNVTSMAQVSPFALTGHYSSSKAALGVAGEALRLELSGTGIHVLEIAPGPVDTAMLNEAHELDGARALIERMPTGNPEELAQLTVRAIERRKRMLVYPRALTSGWWFPALARRITAWLQRNVATDDTRVALGGSGGNAAEVLGRPPGKPRPIEPAAATAS